jgi:hypothetical protein
LVAFDEIPSFVFWVWVIQNLVADNQTTYRTACLVSNLDQRSHGQAESEK